MSECRKRDEAIAAWRVDSPGADPSRIDAHVRVALGGAHLVPLDIRKRNPGAVPGPNPWRAGLNPRTPTGNSRFARRARR